MNYNVAIIILNYNTWEDTIGEIEICNKVLTVEHKDIIVIDNCSPNNSSEKLKEESLNMGFKFIESKENRGYGAGNNIGLRYAYAAGYTHALILNNDINIKDSGLILRLLRVFRAEENVAVVNPDIYSPEGHLFNRDAVRPSFFDYTLGLINYKKKGRKIKDIDGYGYVYRPQGCCMMVDLNKINEVNYFDEKTFLYCEEPILAERLLSKGYLCACNTDISIIHNHSRTVKSMFDVNRIIKVNNDSFAYYLREYRKYSYVKIKVCCLFNAIKLKKLYD